MLWLDWLKARFAKKPGCYKCWAFQHLRLTTTAKSFRSLFDPEDWCLNHMLTCDLLKDRGIGLCGSSWKKVLRMWFLHCILLKKPSWEETVTLQPCFNILSVKEMQWWCLFLSIFLSDFNMMIRACVDSDTIPSFVWRVSFHLSGKYQFSGSFKTRVFSSLPAEDTLEENSALVCCCLGKLCYFCVCLLSNTHTFGYDQYLQRWTGWRNGGYWAAFMLCFE